MLVELGYTPDVTNYLETPAEHTQFQAELKAIEAKKGFAVEIFGFSAPNNMGVQKTPRVTMFTRRFLPSDIGYPTSPQFVADPLLPRKFLNWKMPSRALSMVVEIQLVTSTAEQERLLNQVVNSALGARNYIPFYDNCEENFFLEQTSYYDNLNSTEGVVTKMYQYTVDSINIFGGSTENKKVSAITEITIEPNIVKSEGDTNPIIDSNLSIP